MDDVRPVQLNSYYSSLHKHFKVLVFVFVFMCSSFSFLKVIVYCTFYSVCNTDASDVCTIKITYLLTYLIKLLL